MKLTTVKQLSNKLPASGSSFSVARLTGRREKAIYQILQDKPNLANSLANQVRACLSVLLESCGTTTFPKEQPGQPIDVEARLKLFDTMTLALGDAYYMYCYARIVAMGENLKLTITCNSCNTKNPYTVNLNDLEVEAAASPTDLAREVELPEPVTVGDKQYKKAKIKGMTYSATIPELDDMAQAKSANVATCCSLVGYEFPLLMEIVEDWPTEVINFLNQQINECTPSISSVLEFKCGECKSINPFRIGWEYISFFG